MEDYLIGKDAGRIEDLWNVLYRAGFYRGGPIPMSAISGIEQALWDIKGKALGVPVYELLGGVCHDKMKVYCWIGGDQPDGSFGRKRKYEQGYRAVKMNGVPKVGWIQNNRQIDEAVARLASIREAFGYDMDIAVDFHGRVHKPLAFTLMKELEPYRLLFVEEPVLCENEEIFPMLRQQFSTPIATGERNYTRWGFKQMLARGGVDYIQPDPCHCGGILETKKIAAMAEAYDVALAPHCPLNDCTAVAAQIDFCTHSCRYSEQVCRYPYNQGSDLLDYLKDPSVFLYHQGPAINPWPKQVWESRIDEENCRPAPPRGTSLEKPRMA